MTELHLSSYETRGKEGVKRYGMVIDLRRCIGCDACMWPVRPSSTSRLVNSVLGCRTGSSARTHGKEAFLPRLCNHCDDPPCVRDCPVGATYKVEDGGFVLQRYERCIGCRGLVCRLLLT